MLACARFFLKPSSSGSPLASALKGSSQALPFVSSVTSVWKTGFTGAFAPTASFATTTLRSDMAPTSASYAKVPPTNIRPNGNLFKAQATLPKLPVPPLKDTLEKYLTTVHPLATPEEFQRTQQHVQEFLRPGGVGERLQQRLVDRARHEPTSWLYTWWNDIAYMGYRDPVVINVNYFFQFVDDRGRRGQTERAASLIQAALAFRQLVLSQELTPEMAKTTPLCSIQYNYMFHACRVPRKPSDIIATYDPDAHQHVAVVRKNQFFILKTVDGQGKPLSTADIKVQLEHIKQLAGDEKGLPIGALTTENRDVWSDLRSQLITIPGNREALEKLESAAFLVCLDDTAPVTREEVGRALWHGDGRNRWFDKSLQFIIFENGKAGFNGEHSMMDATPTGRMCEWMVQALAAEKQPSKKKGAGSVHHGHPAAANTGVGRPQPLHFEIPDTVVKGIRTAEEKFDRAVAAHELEVLAYPGYGKGLIKTFGCSPDAYVQMALQLAYYRMYGTCRATYESAQTRKFAYGRTETGRSVSDASVAFVHAMDDPSASASTRVQRCQEAMAYHGKYMKDASEGRGVDRHLLGLRLLLDPSEPKPAVFTDPLFAKSCHWNLSTSQLTSEYFDGYGWGEVVPDGFGLAYMIKENSVHVNVVSQHLGSARLRHYLTEALEDMRASFLEAGANAPRDKSSSISVPKSKL